MNPRYFVLAAVMAAAGCASVPTETAKEKQDRCALTALMTAVGQKALNDGMDEDDFNERVDALEKDTSIDTNDRKVAIPALRRGYDSIEGADEGIMAQKAFDDCMEAK